MKKIFEKISNRFFMALAGLMLATNSAFANKMQDFSFDTIATDAQDALSKTLKPVINIVSIIVALIGVVMLIWNFVKRSKSDGQSNDALVSWGVSLIFVFIALQVIKFIFIGN